MKKTYLYSLRIAKIGLLCEKMQKNLHGSQKNIIFAAKKKQKY